MEKKKIQSYDQLLEKLYLRFNKKFPSAGQEVIFDAIEDAFLDFFKTASIEVMSDEGQTYALLYAITNNNLKDYFADPKRKRITSLDKMLDDGFDLPTQEDWERKFETTDMLNKYLSELSDEDKKLVLLRADKTSFKEIAKIFKKKKNALEQRYSRVIKKLKKIAQEEMGEGTKAKARLFPTANSQQPTANSQAIKKILEIFDVSRFLKKSSLFMSVFWGESGLYFTADNS